MKRYPKALAAITIALVAICLAGVAYSQICTTIQDGGLSDVNGNPITTGYDQWGYNYQAHMYNGLYDNNTRTGDGGTPWTEETCQNAPNGCTNLQMKWNDAWLSNQDCDGDYKLDRHYGSPLYSGSGAWLTNHQSGSTTILVNGKQKEAHWTYFVKIVAPPSDATKSGDKWYAADGTEIGLALWGEFAKIQMVENDPFLGVHGVQYKSPAGPGFGIYGVHP